jgi:hypothetical protein
MSRNISTIANEICTTWRPVNYAAAPYLAAMRQLDSIQDHYGLDSGRSVVLYFLSNSATWRGDKAREIKKELKAILAG